MPCSAGHPETPCAFGHEGRVTREECGRCKFYQPPPHIDKHCKLWDRDKVLCMLPKKACLTCPEYASRPAGRPLQETVQTKAEKKAYEAAYRDRNRDRIQANAKRFKEKNPDYFKDVMRKRRGKK